MKKTEEILYMEEEKCIEGKLSAEQAETEKLTWNMVEHNEIPGIVPFEYYYLNDLICFKYDLSSYQPVISLLEKKEADFRTVSFLLHGIFEIMDRGSAYLLEEKDYLLQPEWIFWNRLQKQVVLCYLPGRKKQEKREVLQLVEYLLQRIDHEDRMAVELAYETYDLLVSDEVSAEEIFVFIKDRIHKGQGKQGDGRSGLEEKVEQKEKERKKEDVHKKENHHKESPSSEGKVWWIGRDQGNDICVPFLTVSRKHLQVFEEDGQLFIMDLASKNGTWLNGKRIPEYRKIKCTEKDMIRMADLSFQIDRNSAGRKPELRYCRSGYIFFE